MTSRKRKQIDDGEDIKRENNFIPTPHKLPFHLEIARMMDLHIPLVKRLHEEETVRHVKKKVIMRLNGELEKRQAEQIETQPEQEQEQESKIPSSIFFLPSPFDALRCQNQETTYLESVIDLVSPLKFSARDLLERVIDEEFVSQRKAVAFGSLQSYRIYSIEELINAWTSHQDFVHPEDHKICFSKDQVDNLLLLLEEEFSKTIFMQVKQVMEYLVLLSQLLAQKALEKFSLFNEKDKQLIHDYLQWLMTAGLAMRGWKGNASITPNAHAYPLTAEQSSLEQKKPIRIVRIGEKAMEQSERERFISYCLIKLQSICFEMTTTLHEFLEMLHSVNYKVPKSDASVFDDSDSEEENDSDQESEGIHIAIKKEMHRHMLRNLVTLEFGTPNYNHDSKSSPETPFALKETLNSTELGTLDLKQKINLPTGAFEIWNKEPVSLHTSDANFTASHSSSSTSHSSSSTARHIKSQVTATSHSSSTTMSLTGTSNKYEIKVLTPSLKIVPQKTPLVYLVNQVLHGSMCYRETSRPLIQGATFWLQILFQLEPPFPVYCVEAIH